MKYLFAAGGTGGHINPALAAAGEIRKRHPDSEILFIGSKGKMEERLVPAAGFDFKTIEISGFYRGLSLKNAVKNVKTVQRVLSSSVEARKIIKEFNPDVVIGFGGYVSGPVLREAAKLSIPSAIHEQNAFPGITNKALAKKVDRVMLTTEKAKQYMEPKNEPIVTGLPVRGELLSADRDISRAQLGVRDDQLLVLSMGGSLGADAINNAMLELICEKHEDKHFYFLHAMGQYGLWMPDKLKEKGVDAENAKNIELREYINDMDKCMSAADIVICRAGASSLSELQAMGKASILIPSPNVAENHQFHNAMALVEKGAALIIEEKDLSAERLKETFESLANSKSKIIELSKNAKSMAIIDAKERIADIIDGLCG